MFREANYHADRLVRMGAELISDFHFLFNPPDVVVEMLARDKVGFVCCYKLIFQ